MTLAELLISIDQLKVIANFAGCPGRQDIDI